MTDLPRRTVLAAPWMLVATPLATAEPVGKKVLRLAFSTAESGFDPVRFADLYSRAVNSHIFEAPYGYDHLARPPKFKPVLADGMLQGSDDFRVWTLRLKPGIYFADDPAFKGGKREVRAFDMAYAILRAVDPANNSPFATSILDQRFLGLAALRQAALDHRKPFDYDAPVAGLQVLGAHTIRFQLERPNPRFIEILAQADIFPVQAREVVEFYGEKIVEHPVGTGPFRLKQWVRGAKIVLERSPHYREVLYDAQPAADDAAGQAIAAAFAGKRLPLVDEVEVSIIEENQPRWLAFLNGQIDGLMGLTGGVPKG